MNTFLQKMDSLIILTLLAGILLVSNSSYAFYQQSEQETLSDTQNNPSNANKKIEWPINLQLLEQQSKADDNFWLQLDEEKTLVLKYFAQGKKLRGNILLLHTEGENPQHVRIIDPLARQLSRLGWQVWSPTLPLADYPIKKPPLQNLDSNSQNANSNTQTSGEESENLPNGASSQNENSPQTNTSQNSEQNASNNQAFVGESQDIYFKTIESYQTFFTQLISQIIGDAAGSPGQFAIVANQTSAFWILPTVASDERIDQLIMIAPQLPKGVNAELEALFQSQNGPVYTFIDDESNSQEFIKAFQKQLWKSSYQRLNRGVIDNLKY
ncbi:MAG: alpha/beta hydrolase family protein, partial [Kangiellaceae bacterium]|nr:alpha/beta hydrolase family protein [Kangiellaceae bacterium]